MPAKLWIGIAVGGGIGASLRYIIIVLIVSEGFPFASLTANLIGCFLLPYILLLPNVDPDVKKMIGTGVIGSFTTFSTFSVESIELLQSGQIFFFFTYFMISLLGGIGLSALSYRWMVMRNRGVQG
ncbi:fluoride efflux transporter CrcB [Salinibacillus xinjiangensis]|uniref:Fluoride-specific ion channel FluC n=1 Tax=Salinibacillus xinjiangensis TaxID=1229268 RepID=A0A6G1X2T2_9BACI|nr:fluoride efflux transporter CrcB [Salinibacillus xinjiangensis]MRG85138.1 fluoride efflux transporter CrcB [Salinibacillus xinjiangensis]